MVDCPGFSWDRVYFFLEAGTVLCFGFSTAELSYTNISLFKFLHYFEFIAIDQLPRKCFACDVKSNHVRRENKN